MSQDRHDGGAAAVRGTQATRTTRATALRSFPASLARRAPGALAGVAALWLLALGTGSLPDGPPAGLAPLVLFDPGTVAQNPLALVLSLAWAPSPLAYLGTTAALLGPGVLAEGRLGSRRFAAAVVATHLAALAGATVLGAAVAPLFPRWADDFGGTSLGGPAFGVLGATLAATAGMGPLWRRRLRILGVLLPLTLVLYDGALLSVALLLAALAGLAAGPFLLRHRPRRRAAPSIRESRVLVALVCAAAAAGPALAALSPHATGPFAVLGVLFTSVEGATPDAVRAACEPGSAVHRCAEAQLQARAGLGGITMSCLPTVLLLVLANGLRRGRRFAWTGTILVQAGLALLSVHMFLTFLHHGADGELAPFLQGAPPERIIADLVVPALQPVAIVLLLVVGRRLFTLRAAPGTYRTIGARVVLALVLADALYVGAGLAVADQFSPVAKLPVLLADFPQRLLPVAATLRIYPAFLPEDSAAVILYEWIGIAFWAVVAVLLLRSFRSVQRTADDADRERARAIARMHGRGSMTWMGLWPGNSYWFDGTSYVPYRVISGVALSLAGPVGPRADRDRALRGFCGYCHAQGWTPCFYSVTGEVAEALEVVGFRRLQVAEETVLDLGSLAFTGRKFQDIRTALNQARRIGVHNEWVDSGRTPLVILDQIRSISEEWVADKALPEMGFTLGGIDELRDPAVRCSVILDDDRTVHAVASWLPIHEDGRVTGWTLDFMRRRGSGFKHSIEVLIAQAALDLQAEGYAQLSLSGAPLARSGIRTGTDVSDDALDRVLALVGRTLEPVYGFRSLVAFKSKFGPRYVPLYLCYEDPATLPSIGQAVGRAYAPDVSAVDVWRLLTAAPRRTTFPAAAPPARAFRAAASPDGTSRPTPGPNPVPPEPAASPDGTPASTRSTTSAPR
ncbi:bifunctional lysylphosphatidylglycerol flippase/synthetase MprF [Arthrobacter sp. MDT3-44]